MTTIYDVLIRPIVTEKSNYQSSKLNQIVFEVAENASKGMIKDAIEFLFEVKVKRINVVNAAPKRTRRQNRQVRLRRSSYKKAIVTLQEGQKIELFEGVK